MSWILIIVGVLLIIMGGYLKYQQLKSRDRKRPSVDGEFTDEYLKRTNKLREIDAELDRLLESIALKEKKIREKLIDTEPAILQTKQLPVDNNFKKLLADNFQGKRELKNSQEGKISSKKIEKTNSKYSSVFALADKGMAVEDIAHKLDLGIRETSLILKLYRKEEDSVV